MLPYQAYIGLGSNLADPVQQINAAFVALDKIEGINLQRQSSLYASAPMGPKDQPDFINAVALISTLLSPLSLLDQLQAIEINHQRKRERHWGPRTLDLDLLLFNDQVIDHARLQVPHVGLTQRNFVLYPLAEIAPSLVLPDGHALQHYLQQCPLVGLTKIDV